ncbi:MAG: glycosyltransferase [Candidatus Altiarchaeales archaeon]|nr:glycosyltransferase [Candidatus Altiarchaeales archaeon]
MEDRILAFVPAFNEERWVGDVVKAVVDAKRRGIIHGIVVVDDGSRDGTRDVVTEILGRQEGAPEAKHWEDGCIETTLKEGTLIKHPRNWGKCEAFITAATLGWRDGFNVLFITDADMTNLSAEKISLFLSHLKPVHLFSLEHEVDGSKKTIGVTPEVILLMNLDKCLREMGVKFASISSVKQNSGKWFFYGDYGREFCLDLNEKTNIAVIMQKEGDNFRQVSPILIAKTDSENPGKLDVYKDVWMLRGSYAQECESCDFRFSGFRAIRLDTPPLTRLQNELLSPAGLGNSRWMQLLNQGSMSLEPALNDMIPAWRTLDVKDLKLGSRQPGGGATKIERIGYDILLTEGISTRRRNLARLIRHSRRQMLVEEDPKKLERLSDDLKASTERSYWSLREQGRGRQRLKQ